MDYYKKYQKYKIKYLELSLNSTYHQIGMGHKIDMSILNKYDSLLLNDLIEINKNISLQYSKDGIIKREKEYEQYNKKIIKKEMKRMIGPKEKIDENKIFNLNVKYESDVILEKKYLDKYNNVIKTALLSIDLYNNGFYEYVFKLKQHLNKCGVNRTTQLYGTCWFNTAINGFIFSNKLRGRTIQLLLFYKNSFSEKEFNKIIDDMDKQKYKLNQTIDRNMQNIFYHIIAILYKTLCHEGLRNKNPKKYENFSLTNLALNLKNLFTESKKINVRKIEEIAYVPIYGLNMITYVFNKFIDEDSHIKTFTNIMNNTYSLSNMNHINMLYFDNNNNDIKIHAGYEYSKLMFKNITIDINSNGINSTFKAKEGENIDSLKNIDFLILVYDNVNVQKIPFEVNCIVDNKKTLFKLDHAVICISTPSQKISHVVSGLICNNEYYIYDSAENLYFECNWTDLSNKNNMIKPNNYYQIKTADYIFYTQNIENTSGKFFKLYNKSTLNKFQFEYKYVIYYNTQLDFSYDTINCSPKRI